MKIASFDHVAIPIKNEDEMVSFYSLLGFAISKLDDLTYAVQFGENKIHFHTRELWTKKEFELRGPTAKPGCGDFCFVWAGNLESVLQYLDEREIPVNEGRMKNIGARNNGQMIGQSVYVRDPDLNLLEFIVYDQNTV